MSNTNSNTLKRGFEIYYFDGLGGRQGPIDFEELLTLLGAMDEEERAGSDADLYGQLTLPLTSDPSASESVVSDRVSKE